MRSSVQVTSSLVSSPHYLAIDVGTSSTRVSVWNRDGISVPGSSYKVEYTPLRRQPGESVFEVDDWQQAIISCLDQVHQRVQQEHLHIAGVGSCTFWHSCLGVNAAYRPVTPLFTWADTRCEDIFDSLQPAYHNMDGHAVTGCPLHSSFYPMRLRWHAMQYPEVHSQVHCWLSPGEWLLHLVTGAKVSSISMASATGLFDSRKSDWSEDALELAGIDRRSVQPIDDTVGAYHLSNGFRERWPKFAAAPWALSIGDGAAGNVGSGCLVSGMAAINLGTSGAIRLAAAKDDAPVDGLWRYQVDKDSPLLGAAFSDGGDAVAWALKILKIDDPSSTFTAIASRARGRHGLTVLPYLTGERCPGWRPGASAVIEGLRLTTEATDIVQSIMESVVLQFSDAVDRMASVGVVPSKIIASGGGFHIPGWAEMLADALGRQIQLAAEPEMTSRGAAAFGMVAAGDLERPSHLAPPVSATVYPTEEGPSRMQDISKRQKALYTREVQTKGER